MQIILSAGQFVSIVRRDNSSKYKIQAFITPPLNGENNKEQTHRP